MPHKDKAASKAYFRAYYLAHREEKKGYQRRYHRSHKDAIKAYRRRHSTHIRAVAKQYRDTHKERRQRTRSTWHANNRTQQLQKSRAWKKANRDRALESSRSYYAAHRRELIAAARRRQKANWDRVKAWLRTARHNRRQLARKNGGKHTTAQWLSLCECFHNCCLRCGLPRPLTRDHIVPLCMGGSNAIDNIQPLCHPCNSAKGKRIVDYRPKDFRTPRLQTSLAPPNLKERSSGKPR